MNFTDKAGFGNNFTTMDNKSTAQSVEGIIVSAMFKSLITRCASTTHELHSSENLVRTRLVFIIYALVLQHYPF